ncbi:hypothetical protein GDO81_007220 [Engystomops pustulosus]|uniref:Uncharacterized protein n=1 Tax=Engystomops pustulosus TaxID=76066 RepID=A0AAV7C7C2_ENGPU|nr:hypothetical protein GDO81_007220 [Engystomops pustulosus]
MQSAKPHWKDQCERPRCNPLPWPIIKQVKNKSRKPTVDSCKTRMWFHDGKFSSLHHESLCLIRKGTLLRRKCGYQNFGAMFSSNCDVV